MSETRIDLIRGDITRLAVDAVVNAANSSLMGGGGVDGAIHRAAGPGLHEECMRIAEARGNVPGGPCPAGHAVITGAGRLPCKKVIHTVGPVWRGGLYGERELLAGCYRNSLALAVSSALKVIAFPNIGTGVYGYPKREAACTALETVRKCLEEMPEIEKVIFVCFDDENFRIYQELLDKELPDSRHDPS
ncbi:MAG: O-acetyl-ADP-ribose deacetylase [Treponema sp.]|jgi:O-acetyl-ADP-ribose deacetylase (regulator of RNase III)|nr:O-acetyl-ADP-ribose deacetylase [Treponema sp.]